MDIDERIRRIEQKKASRAAEEQRQSQERRHQKERERKMEKQDREQTCERILRESGVLAILEQLKAKRLDGREKKVALVVKHELEGFGIHVELAWGKQFTVRHNFIAGVEVTEGFFNRQVYTVWDYSAIEVKIWPFSENITVGGKETHSVPYSDIDAIEEAIAEAFVNPRRHGPSKYQPDPNPPDDRSGIGGWG